MKNCKRIITFTIILLFSNIITVEAQLENILLSPNTVINKVYFGLRSDIKALTDSSTVPILPMGNVRIGLLVNHTFNKKIAIESQAALQFGNNTNTISIPAFEFIYKLNSSFHIRAGHLVTPTTTTRPNPITWQSQVETYTQSRIIGSKPGLMLRYTISPNWFVATALHYQNNHWATHLRIDYKTHRLAGYFQTDSTYFISFKSSFHKFESNINFNKFDNELASSLFFNFNDQFTVYADFNRKFKVQQTDVLTLGLRSYFKANKLPIAGFFGVYYDFIQKYVAGQFFIHLAELKKK